MLKTLLATFGLSLALLVLPMGSGGVLPAHAIDVDFDGIVLGGDYDDVPGLGLGFGDFDDDDDDYDHGYYDGYYDRFDDDDDDDD